MHKINNIVFKNFKFFHNKETIINLKENNLLLYGENGSGKSSIYWGLYTLLQSVYKEKMDVESYFEVNGKHSLANSHMTDGQDSYVKLFLTNNKEDEKESIISFNEVNTKDSDRLVKQFAKYTSFINFKSLFNHHNFLHREEIDLFPVFEYDILHSTDFGIGAESLEGKDYNNSYDVWEEIKDKKIDYLGLPNEAEINREEEDRFDELINSFNNSFEKYLLKINALVDTILGDDFQYNFSLNIRYEGVEKLHHPDDYSLALPPKISVRISENGKPIPKPQSYLNEAKLTAIALAIKFSVTLEKYEGEEKVDVPKLLVFDDIMISMDMGNREKVTSILLDRFSDFQIIFFTHDLNFYKYIGHKIDQKGNGGWTYKEMHNHKNNEFEHDHPILIDSYLTPIKKAKFYYQAKDFTTCSLYLRQAIEGKIKDRLPDELYKRTDDKFTNLNSLWISLINRYQDIGIEIDSEAKQKFESSKLLVLNPRAHHQDIELPAYQYEIDQIFDFVNYLDDLKKPTKTILLSKGMVLQFTHPSKDYSIEYLLLSDCSIDSVEEKKVIIQPKCKTIYWQYEKIDLKHPDSGEIFTEDVVAGFNEHLLKIKVNELCECKTLEMDEEIFMKNTTIKNTLWKLSDVFVENETKE